MFVVKDANTGEVLETGFATISDALDASERIDPDESRGVYACAAERVFCGTDGHYCSVGCQVRGEHRDWAFADPWVAVARER